MIGYNFGDFPSLTCVYLYIPTIYKVNCPDDVYIKWEKQAFQVMFEYMIAKIGEVKHTIGLVPAVHITTLEVKLSGEGEIVRPAGKSVIC